MPGAVKGALRRPPAALDRPWLRPARGERLTPGSAGVLLSDRLVTGRGPRRRWPRLRSGLGRKGEQVGGDQVTLEGVVQRTSGWTA
jgi:hypothetical protein